MVAILGGLPGLYLTWSAYRDDRRDADRDARLSLPEVGDELARATQAPTGRPLAEVTDPFALEVHRPVEPDSPEPGLTVLPLYVAREHDSELGQVVVAAAEGRSGIAVLVGGSSTGKTRACWEALRLLRDEEPGWRLWHPINPSRPDAALRELSAIGPRTVVWLNEAQFYLDAPGGLGEQVAAGLRELLRDPSCGPVLVLATIWLDSGMPSPATLRVAPICMPRRESCWSAMTSPCPPRSPVGSCSGSARWGTCAWPRPPMGRRTGRSSSSWPGRQYCRPATATHRPPRRR